MNTPVPLPAALPPVPNLTEEDLIKLAREVVQDIFPLSSALARYSLTQSQYDLHVKDNPFFKRITEQYRIEWEATTNTATRLKIKAAAAMEDGLSTLAARMIDKHEDLGKATETAKLIARLAGVDGADKNASTGEKITIEINLGGDQQIKIEKEAEPITIEGTVTARSTSEAISPDAEGRGGRETVQTNGEAG